MICSHKDTIITWLKFSKQIILLAGGDAAFIAKALGDIARAKGMSQVARDAGLSRESLHKAYLENEVQVSTQSSKL